MKKLNLQIFNHTMYDQKLLYSQYIYNCIVSPQIKAYVPAQVLSLVNDMNRYSLSYFQGCRSFDYCLQKMLQINPTQRLEVNCHKAIQIIQSLIKKNFNFMHETDWLNILKVILTKEVKYKISDKELQLCVSFRRFQLDYEDIGQQRVDQQQIAWEFLEDVTQCFKRNLPADLLSIFEREEEIENKEKQQLEELKNLQIINCYYQHDAQDDFGKQGNEDYQNINKKCERVQQEGQMRYSQRFKPYIRPNLVDAMMKQDKVEELIKQISSDRFKPLSSLFALFGQDNQGEGLYLIKTLQLSGLITLNKKQKNPLVYYNFYKKAKFD